MNITNAKYTKDLGNQNTSVKVTVEDKILFVPMSTDNTDYAEIMRQVDAGELTIEPADE
jgi:hypothetical protein